MNEILGINGFLRKINLLYPATFKNDEVIDTWNDAAIKVLDKFSINWSKLYDIVINENPRGNFAPELTWIKDKALKCLNYPTKEIVLKWREPLVYDPIRDCRISTDAFPINATNEQILEFYRRKYGNSDRWEILEG